MHLIRNVLVLAMACTPLAARAADPDWPASCDADQMSMNACAFQRWQKADRELNALYGKLMKQADADKLQAAQRAWVQYRDLECKYEGADSEGGSLQPQDIANCNNRITRQRLADFRLLLR